MRGREQVDVLIHPDGQKTRNEARFRTLYYLLCLLFSSFEVKQVRESFQNISPRLRGVVPRTQTKVE